MTLPTIKQKQVRSTGHVWALQRISEGRALFDQAPTMSQMMGMKRLVATLLRWRVIEIKPAQDSEHVYRLTERGAELLEASRQKAAAALASTP